MIFLCFVAQEQAVAQVWSVVQEWHDKRRVGRLKRVAVQVWSVVQEWSVAQEDAAVDLLSVLILV